MKFPKYKTMDTTDLHVWRQSEKIAGGYQRELDDPRILKMALDFTPAIFGVLNVSHRLDSEPGGGLHYVNDGQNRLSAAILADVERLPCVVIEDTTIEQEAEMFARQNENQKNVSQFNRFEAFRVAGREQECQIHTVMTKHGFKTGQSASKDVNTIGAIRRLYRISERGGIQLLDDVLEIINAVWPISDGRAEDKVLHGMHQFLMGYEHKLDKAMVIEVLRASKFEPGVIRQNAKNKNDRSEAQLGKAVAKEIKRVYDVTAGELGYKKLYKPRGRIAGEPYLGI